MCKEEADATVPGARVCKRTLCFFVRGDNRVQGRIVRAIETIQTEKVPLMRLNTSGFTDFKNFDKILEKEVDRMETW